MEPSSFNSAFQHWHSLGLNCNLGVQRAVQHTIVLVAMLMSTMMANATLQNYPTQTDMSCHDANATCYLKEECRVRMELLQATCGPYGLYCSLPQPKKDDKPGQSYVEYCRSALRSIKKLEPDFRCYCTLALSGAEYSKCITVWRYLEQHPCVENPQWITSKPHSLKNQFIPNRLEPTFVSQLSIDRTTRSVDLHTPTQMTAVQLSPPTSDYDVSSSHNCLVVEKRCDKLSSCKAASHHFLRSCRGSKSQCLHNKMKCLLSYENVRQFELFTCNCHQQNDQFTSACSSVQRSYQKNACLEYYESQTISGRSAAEPKQDAATPKRNLQTQIVPNCYSVFKKCTRLSACLVQMVRLSEDCQWSESADVCINYEKCQKALSTFYTTNEHDLSTSALNCQCADQDTACSNQRELFRPRCAYRDRVTPSCLQLHNMCESDTKRCFERLTWYYRMCSVYDDSGQCVYSKAECHERRRHIWGTVLTLNCTCSPLESDDRDLIKNGFRKTCREIQNRLIKPPCVENDRLKLGQMKVGQQEQEVCSLVQEKEVRLYYNATCSRLCMCSRSGDKILVHNCRKLYCTNQSGSASCVGFQYDGCQCVDGTILCTKKSYRLTKTSGLFLSAAYSMAEYQAMNQHGSEPVNMNQMATSLTKLLSQLTGRQQCGIALAWENATQGQAVFRVHPWQPKSQSSAIMKQIFSLCDYSMRLLSFLIARRDPQIIHNPHLSVLKLLQVGTGFWKRQDSTQVLATPVVKRFEASNSIRGYEKNIGSINLAEREGREDKSDATNVRLRCPQLLFVFVLLLWLQFLI